MSQIARLMHLIDSSLPTGSFAYSMGLESSITFGLIKDSFGLRSYLYTFLQQTVSFDYPFINSCLALQFPDLNEELKKITKAYDTLMLVPATRKASLVQAKNWNKLFASFYPEAGILEIKEWFIREDVPLHYLFAFALSLKRGKFSMIDIKRMHLHMCLRDQVSAAIRLGFLGPMEGHKLQHDFYTIFDDLIVADDATPYTAAYRSAFLLDVAQVYHEDIYSKLFQN